MRGDGAVTGGCAPSAHVHGRLGPTQAAHAFRAFCQRRQARAQVMFVLFSVGAALWAVTLARSWALAHRLHVLMGVLAGFKALTLLSQAGELHLVKTSGHTGNWNIAFYVFTFLRGILFFTARPRLLALWCPPLALLPVGCSR